jgi:Ion channel
MDRREASRDTPRFADVGGCCRWLPEGVRQVTIDSHAAQHRESVADRPAQFRYGAVFLLTLAVVVFVIAAPSADWSRALTLAIEGAALVVAVATARERAQVRYRRALVVGVVMIVLILGVAIGAVSEQLTAAMLALVTAAVPVEIVRGVVRLLRERGVTGQAVAGALAIYLSIGLVFASVISFITHVDSTVYFAQHTNGTEGDRVYFSFTTLTTTGFGDFSAATPAGHALAVIEMLTGQLYLVTVIGLLIGTFVERRKTT